MQDILIGDGSDLQIANGDLVIGASDLQHQQLLLMAAPGSFKQFPKVGVGLLSYLNDESDSGDILRQIRQQFAADGLNVTQVAIVGDKIQVDANY